MFSSWLMHVSTAPPVPYYIPRCVFVHRVENMFVRGLDPGVAKVSRKIWIFKWDSKSKSHKLTRWWFQISNHVFVSSPFQGKIFQFDDFFRWLLKRPTRKSWFFWTILNRDVPNSHIFLGGWRFSCVFFFSGTKRGNIKGSIKGQPGQLWRCNMVTDGFDWVKNGTIWNCFPGIFWGVGSACGVFFMFFLWFFLWFLKEYFWFIQFCWWQMVFICPLF